VILYVDISIYFVMISCRHRERGQHCTDFSAAWRGR